MGIYGHTFIIRDFPYGHAIRAELFLTVAVIRRTTERVVVMQLGAGLIGTLQLYNQGRQTDRQTDRKDESMKG